jgi:hypothetical protein
MALADLGDRGHVDGVVEAPVPAPAQPAGPVPIGEHRQDAAAPVSKLGARNRTQAVEQARALGLLAPFLSQAPIGGSGA